MPMQNTDCSGFYAFLVVNHLHQGATDTLASKPVRRRTYWHPQHDGSHQLIAAMRDLREDGDPQYWVNSEVARG